LDDPAWSRPGITSKRIEDITGVPPAIVSVGPDRFETLLLKNPFEI